MKNNVLLKSFIEEWFLLTVVSKVRDSSRANYERQCRYIEKYLGPLEISFIDRQKIQKFIYAVYESENLSNGTAHAIVMTLKRIFKTAHEYGYIRKNPTLNVKLPLRNEKEVITFSREEQRKLEAEIIKGNDFRETAVLICLYTGLRLGEICALTWEHVDLENRLFYIKKSISRVKNYKQESVLKTKIIETEPKTRKSKRYIPLPDFLARMLEKRLKEKGGKYVIPAKHHKDYPVQPRTLQCIYKKLLSKIAVPYRNFHALRHTFATRSAELGADIKSLSEILGHSNVNITMNRYVHSQMDQKRKIMSQMDNLFVNFGNNL